MYLCRFSAYLRVFVQFSLFVGLGVIFLAQALHAKPLELTHKNAQTIQIDEILTHISTFDNMIFVGNAGGKIDIFTLQSQKAHKIQTLTLPPIHDYFGNSQMPRIYDVTTFDGKTLFVLAEGSKGTKQILELPLQSPQNLKSILQTNTSPKRIVAYDRDKLVVGFLSNEIGLFDLKSKTFIYNTHPSLAGFSDLCVNPPLIFSTDESGIVNVINITDGKILKRLDMINKDNNYQIVSAQNTILTASVDRQMAIYTFKTNSSTTDGKILKRLDMINKDNNYQIVSAQNTILTASVDRQMAIYTFKTNSSTPFALQNATKIQSEFLIYAVGISPNGTLGAYSKNEQNDIAIINLTTKQELFTLKGATSLINTLIFYDEQTLIVGSDDKHFVIWQLGAK